MVRVMDRTNRDPGKRDPRKRDPRKRAAKRRVACGRMEKLLRFLLLPCAHFDNLLAGLDVVAEIRRESCLEVNFVGGEGESTEEPFEEGKWKTIRGFTIVR